MGAKVMEGKEPGVCSDEAEADETDESSVAAGAICPTFLVVIGVGFVPSGRLISIHSVADLRWERTRQWIRCLWRAWNVWSSCCWHFDLSELPRIARKKKRVEPTAATPSLTTAPLSASSFPSFAPLQPSTIAPQKPSTKRLHFHCNRSSLARCTSTAEISRIPAADLRCCAVKKWWRSWRCSI